MDRVVGLIIGVSVVLVAAVVVTTIFSSQIADFTSSVDDKEESGCEFQAENTENFEELSPECKKLKYDPRVKSCLSGSSSCES